MRQFKHWKQPKIKDGIPTKWGWVVKGVKNFKLGKNTDIGYGVYIQAEGGVTIEDDVQIGGGAKIYSVNTIDNTKGKVVLKKGSNIGANSVILPNVVLGEKATIGALSLAGNKKIPAGEVWGGVPVKPIR